MKRVLIIIISSFVILSCSKEEPVVELNPTESESFVPAPHWKLIENHQLLPATMTAIAALPIEYDKEHRLMDELAVFVGEECRGIAEYVENNGEGKWVVVVYSDGSRDEKFYFKHYMYSRRQVFTSIETFKFAADTRLGNFDNPIMIQF